MTNAIHPLANTFAPTGELRVAINMGNPIFARRHHDTVEPEGVSIDLATQQAKRLGVPLKLVVFEAASKSVKAVSGEEADEGFFAIDPLRWAAIAFTAPYILIEGAYMGKNDSLLQSNAEVEQAQHRVVVDKGSAYDLYLSREIKHAQLVRSPTSPEVVSFFFRKRPGFGTRCATPARSRVVTYSVPAHVARPLHGHRASHGFAQEPWP